MAGLFTDFEPIQSLAANQYGTSASMITKGSLVSFNYPRSFAVSPNVIHDPRPMVIITDIWPQFYLRGVNLHYLTFPYVKRILEMWGGDTSFSYSHIRADRYLASAFRMYNMKGIRQAKRLDSEWLKTVLQSVRTFDAGEIEKIRAKIQQQIQARLQAKASELTMYEQWRKGVNQVQQTMNMPNSGNQMGATQPGIIPNTTQQQNPLGTEPTL